MALLYPELSKRILGIAMQLHREMGCGFKEKVYQDAITNLACCLTLGPPVWNTGGIRMNGTTGNAQALDKIL